MANQKENDCIITLRELIEDIDISDDDKDFLSDQTLRRYLIAREWNVTEAEKMLRATVDWRREMKPQTVVCSYCQEHPGYHAMRQVGFDRQERPVFYSNFSQCWTQRNCVDDAIMHIVYLIENAKRVMAPEVYQFVWVMDFTGMRLTSCNPHLGLSVEKILSNHYPERLGAVLCVNHGLLFHGFWKAVKGFIYPSTVAKVHIHRHHEKIDEVMTELFSEELKIWLYDEIRFNKEHPLSESQQRFWKKTERSNSDHNPWGSQSYVQKYLDNNNTEKIGNVNGGYKPHPNILQTLLGELMTD